MLNEVGKKNGYSIKGKRFIVYGAARSGFAAAGVILRRGGTAIIIDDASKMSGERKRIAGELIADGGIILLGPSLETKRELLRDADTLILSPGVQLADELREVSAGSGCEIMGELGLAARLCPCPIIAISGSNGKTTTVSLLFEFLKAAGFRTHLVGNVGSSYDAADASGYFIGEKKVLFAGEVGVPFCERLDAINQGDIVVAEVSSYQLESAADFHPGIAVLLNIVEDHLARHGDMDGYIAAKGRMMANQGTGDTTVLNVDDPLVMEAYKVGGGSGDIISFSLHDENADAYSRDGIVYIKVDDDPALLLKREEFSLPGDHNIENLMAAALAARAAGAGLDGIRRVAREFRGVEHRIEWVGEFNGVNVYNDSKATNPDSTIKALAAFDQPVVLILGGYEKGSDFTPLYEILPDNVRHMLIIGSTSERLDHELGARGIGNRTVAGDLAAALDWIKSNGTSGDILLLSPASASFDQYESYEERGRVFKKLTKEKLAGK